MDASRLDAAVESVAARADHWAHLPVTDKLTLLRRLRPRIGRVAARWVAAATKAKGLPPGSPLVGEEWTSGPYALAEGIHALEQTLERLAAGRHPLDGLTLRIRPDGRVAVPVFPGEQTDRLLLSGFSAEVWIRPGISPEEVRERTAARHRDPRGETVLVLGAGNIASIPALDLLHELFVNLRVAVVKLNPVNEYLGEFFEEIFAPLVDAGFVAFTYGGAEVGEHLVLHPAVDAVHVTGSSRTYDAIVFGSGEEGRRRKERDDPRIAKPVTAELGGVGPTIVVPGRWTRADLRFQAEHVATKKLHNAGFNCIACQVLVVPREWPQTDAFLDELRTVLRRVAPRPLYYPGAEDRLARIAAHPRAERIGDGLATRVLVEVPPDDVDDRCFVDELFAPALTVTRLPGTGPVAFLGRAVDFANDVLTGTLGANLLADPATLRAERAAVERAIADLRYGTVALNTWTGVGFLLPRATWGAFPGHTRTDIQSGVGVVHNALMLSDVERTVVRGPFAPLPRAWLRGERHLSPKPPFFVTHRRADEVGERLTRYAVGRSPRHLPGIVIAALRG